MARRKDRIDHAPASSIEFAIEEHEDFSTRKKGEAGLDPRFRIILILIAVTVVVFLFGLVVPKHIFDESAHLGNYNSGYTLAWFIRDLSTNLSSLFAVLVGDLDAGKDACKLIISYIVILFCGGGLALCGAVYQGTFRNALVSPSTLGVMRGAGLGMALWVLLFYDPTESHGLWFENDALSVATNPLVSLWNSYSLSLCSFVGCVMVVGLVVLVIGTVGRGSTSGLMMIIAGQIIGAVMGGLTSSIRYYFVTVDPEGAQAQMMMQLQISSFYRSYSLIDVFAVGVPILVMFAVVMRYRSQLTLLAFSEEEARAMGVETRRMRFLIVGLATLVTAIIVSFCGSVGFVGFMIPHLARRLVGPNFTYLMPLSLVAGALFVLTAYVLTTMILGSIYANMTGMFISIGGAVVFLVTAIKGVGSKRGSF